MCRNVFVVTVSLFSLCPITNLIKGKTQWYGYQPSDRQVRQKYGTAYLRSVSYEDGMFNPRILFASEVRYGGGSYKEGTTIYEVCVWVSVKCNLATCVS